MSIGGGLLLFAVLAVLTLTLLQLHDSGGHIESQDKKFAALFDAARPLAANANEVAAGARNLAGDLQPALREAGGFVAPLLESGSGADLAQALDRDPDPQAAGRPAPDPGAAGEGAERAEALARGSATHLEHVRSLDRKTLGEAPPVP